jgi:hypothetical protein
MVNPRPGDGLGIGFGLTYRGPFAVEIVGIGMPYSTDPLMSARVITDVRLPCTRPAGPHSVGTIPAVCSQTQPGSGHGGSPADSGPASAASLCGTSTSHAKRSRSSARVEPHVRGSLDLL